MNKPYLRTYLIQDAAKGKVFGRVDEEYHSVMRNFLHDEVFLRVQKDIHDNIRDSTHEAAFEAKWPGRKMLG